MSSDSDSETDPKPGAVPPWINPKRPIAPWPEPEEGEQVIAEIAEPAAAEPKPDPKPAQADEVGGPKRLEPTRFGDWENKGRCVDF